MGSETREEKIIEKKTEEEKILFLFNRALSSVGENGRLESAILEIAKERFGGDHGILFDFEGTSGGLKIVAKYGEVEEMLSQDIRIFAQFATDHPENPESVIIATDAKKVKKLAARKSVRRNMTKEVLIMPLAAAGQAKGVIYVGSKNGIKLNLKDITEEKALVYGGIFGEMLSFKHTLRQLELQNVALMGEIKRKEMFEGLLGTSDAVKRLATALEIVAPTDVPITLIGEAGTRKNQIAEEIHESSDRKRKPFAKLPVNEIPESIMESMIFGQSGSKGKKGYKGVLREVREGTLYIENVHLLPVHIQKRLFKSIETGKATTVDGNSSYALNVRLIFSTEELPKKLISDKQLDASLYMKMSLYPILLPPLRDRFEDLPVLVGHYMEKASAAFGKSIVGIDSEVYDYLAEWSWPENLVELEKEIRYAVLRTPDKHGTLNASSLSPHLVGKRKPVVTDPDEGTLKQRVSCIEKRLIIDALETNNHNQSVTADQLGLSRQALINKLHRYGIETGRKYKRMMKEIVQQAEED